MRQSADTAEATMKVLSQHAKALAQAHMKLQSAKEEADSNLKKANLKVISKFEPKLEHNFF